MNNEFNNIIKRHVNAHESDIDPQDLWDGILAKQKPKRRKWIIIIPIVMGFGLSLSSIWWLNQNPTSSLYTEASVSTIHNTDKSRHDGEPVQTTDVQPTSKSELLVPTAPTNPQPQSQYALNPNTISIQSQTQNQTHNQQTRRNELQFATMNPQSKNKYANNPNPISAQEQTINQTQNQQPKKGALPFATTNKIYSQSTGNGELPFKQTRSLASRNFILKLDKLLPQKTRLLSKEEEGPRTALLNGYSKRPLLSSITFQSTLGSMFLSKSITGADSYKNARQASEKMLESYTSNFSVRISLSPKWSIETGLAYQRDYQKFDWKGTLLRNAAGDNLVVVNENVPLVLPQNFTDVYYETVDQTIQYYNSYKYIDLPVSVSYSNNIGRWRTSISAGVAINIHKKFNGKYLSESELPQDLESLLYNVSVSPKYQAGLSVLYPFTSKIGFLASVDYALRNVKEATVSTRYEGIGLRLGLAYKLK